MPVTAPNVPKRSLFLIKPSVPVTPATPKYQPPPAVAQGPLATRFGHRLRSLRQAKGMTQLEVAVTFGIDRTFLSDLERGRKSVSLPFIEIFALGYGLSISDLLAGL